MSDPRATTGQFASWGHPCIMVADVRASRRRQHAADRVMALIGNGEPVAKIAAWLGVSEDDVNAVVDAHLPSGGA